MFIYKRCITKGRERERMEREANEKGRSVGVGERVIRETILYYLE